MTETEAIVAARELWTNQRTGEWMSTVEDDEIVRVLVESLEARIAADETAN